jgi:hydroxyacylglutathione hydrolase
LTDKAPPLPKAAATDRIKIEVLRALEDNYVYLIHTPQTGAALVIDPSEAAPVRQALTRSGTTQLGLTLNTHHHWDHVGGNLELKADYACKIFCSSYDLTRVPGAERGLNNGEHFQFDGVEIEVLAIPGHTQGQIAYHLPQVQALFVGDTVFAMGCGRLLEGRPEQMLASLQKIAALDPATGIFFGHDYTEKNAQFALQFEPGNSAIHSRLQRYRQTSKEAAKQEIPTIGLELETNPFFRLHSAEIRQNLALSGSELEIFTELRRRRDQF